jgi:hypothetical protein
MIKHALVLATFLSLPVFGQDYPVNQFLIGGTANGIINGPATILVGPNFAHSLSTRDRGPGGIETSYTRNLNRWFGLTSDFSAYFSGGTGIGNFSIPAGTNLIDLGNSVFQKTSNDTQAYNFEFGPQFRFQNHTRFTPYVRTLGGVAHTHASFDTAGAALTQHNEDSRTGASLVFGGGVDVRVVSRASVRLGADYNPTFLGTPYPGVSSVQNNVRLNLGVVFHSRYDH